MTKLITLDPLTRVEGHLAVKTQIENGRVTAAFVAGEMFRGFEVFLRGRDPLDAQHVTQRVCGVCSVEHGVASVLAQENAFGIEPATNGLLMRNLMQGANYLASHITHFYLLSALDFVDVTAVLAYSGKEPGLVELKVWAQQEIASKRVLPVAPFLPRYVGDYLKDANMNIGALHHYLQALEMRSLAQKLGAIFAGKMPHAATLVPGGVTEHCSALRVEEARGLLARIQTFIKQAYLPDVLAVASAYPGYFELGRGPGNFLSYGVFPEVKEARKNFLPSGALMRGTLEALDTEQISEDVGFSLFSSPSGLKPFDGQTKPAPDKANAYSWLKAPRYENSPMEVGPLARMLVAYHADEPKGLKQEIDGLLKQLGLESKHLNSVMGRHAARAIECRLVAERCVDWLDQLVPEAPCTSRYQVPESCRGIGLTEAARGALGHWLEVKDRKISSYQLVVPTTWNASPRDDRGIPGPIEQALIGTPVADPENPIEVARVVRAFDPCLACAVH